MLSSVMKVCEKILSNTTDKVEVFSLEKELNKDIRD